MLYDLNIAWSPATPAADIERVVSFSASLGYGVVALNHILTPPIPAQVVNPLAKLELDQARKAHGSTKDEKQRQAPPTTPTVLHRATLILSDPTSNYRLPALSAAYDLLAIRPTTEKAFTAACLHLPEASLISLDLTAHFPFHFRPKPCMAAVARGLRFEICYAQALAAPDPRARANFIANAVELVRATRGRGIVLSSEAKSSLQLRAPADVVNLMAVWGLSNERGMEALGVNPRGVVVNESLKRSGFRGVVDIVQAAASEEGKANSEEDDNEAEESGTATSRGKGKQEKKRKNGGNEPMPDAEAQPLLSKRQAKKQKKLAKR